MPAQTPQICLIVHGQRQDDPRLDAVVEMLRSRGARVLERVTEQDGDAERFAEAAADDGADRVLAAGGDGMLNAVATGLYRYGDGAPSFGVIPLGTANDFAMSLNVPEEPVDAAALVLDQPATPIDLGLVNGQPFVNIAVGGYGAEVTNMTPKGLKKVLGGAAYTLTGLSNVGSLRTLHGRFEAERFRWDGWFFAFAVGNGRRSGGGRLLCPDALLDDGLLDVTIVPGASETDPAWMLELLLTRGLDGLPDAAVRAQVRNLQVHVDEPVHVNRDGEGMQSDRLDFAVRPRSLRVHLPADAPMLQDA